MVHLINGVEDVCHEGNLPSVSGYLFLTLINSLIAGKRSLGSQDPYPKDSGPSLVDGDVFDFIIVGAGSAGSVVASRLSENGQYKVLVLEAGGYPSSLSDVPAFFQSIQGSEEDWIYKTEKNENHCIGLTNSKCNWPRGKALGGSSSINAMLYIRGNKRDYDTWAEEGNTGWDYESVLKTYKEIENIRDESIRKLGSYGTDGSLPLTKYKYNEPIRNSIVEAFETLGIPEVSHENIESPLGIFDTVQNIHNGQRANAAKAFLGNAKDRENLFVATNALVTKIIIDKHSNKANGVEVVINNKPLSFFASEEVIVSSGAINTPQLLMLSGIGPKNHLEGFGIDVIQDLSAVGNDLQDHLVFSMYFKVDDTALEPKPETYMLDQTYEYFVKRHGDLSQIRISNLVGYINTKNSSIYPDLQYHFLTFNKDEKMPLEEYIRVTGYTGQMANRLRAANKESGILVFWLILLNPKSKGKIVLKSSNPFEKPFIHAGYLTDEHDEDLETILEGVRFTQKIVNTKSMTRHNAELVNCYFEACEKFEIDSDDFWRCCIRHLATTLYHPTSTARMGVDRNNSVVDPNLKVHGVKNLRVVDASIMPAVISGNTNAPSMMIGQKGSEIILENKIKENAEL